MLGLQNFPDEVVGAIQFEIRFEDKDEWHIIENGEATSFTGTARVAGKFKVRVIVEVGDMSAKTPEESIEVQFPDADEILAGDGVRARMDQVWQDTLDYANASRLREVGYFITLNTQTGTYGETAFSPGDDFPSDYSVLPIAWTTAPRSRPNDSIMEPTPLSQPTYTVAWFHTHPVVEWLDNSLVRPVGPSDGDHGYSARPAINIPGYAYDYIANLQDNGDSFVLGGTPKNAPADVYNIPPPNRRPTP